MKHVAYIHGLNSTQSSFSYIVKQLPEHHFHLINYQSHQPLAESIIQVLKQLPREVPLSLVGHSLGGVIATLIAADNLEKIERLVTISSPLNGSRAAATLRWIPGSLPVLNDIVPRSALLTRLGGLELKVPTISIISTGGHLPTSPEPNDSVVSVSSQKALRFGKKIEVKANHFEVLLSDVTVNHIREFLWNTKKGPNEDYLKART